jgi:hypothetical protein
MVISFLGLTGPQGVLPQHYTQLLIDRVRRKDFALRDYFDIFHHRMVSLFLPSLGEVSRRDRLRAVATGRSGETDLFWNASIPWWDWELGIFGRGLSGTTKSSCTMVATSLMHLETRFPGADAGGLFALAGSGRPVSRTVALFA